jgi:hypothetical protein
MKRIIISVMLLLAAAASPAAGRELLSFDKTLVSSEDPSFAPAINDAQEQAGRLIERLYGGLIGMSPAGSALTAAYSVTTVASKDKDALVVVLSLTRRSDGAQTPSLTWAGPLTADMPRWMSRALFLLWSFQKGFLAGQEAAAPVVVDELPGSILSPTMPPLAITVTPSGSLVVAMAMTCIEIDHASRLIGQPGRQLADMGVPVYAGGVSSTPGGSLFLKPITGRDVYRVQSGAAEPQRIPTGLELSTLYSWAALADGSVLFADTLNRKAYRVAQGRKRQELPLFSGSLAWPSAFTAGPDGTIWAFDPLLRGFRVFTMEGSPVDVVLPLLDPSVGFTPMSLSIGPDGGIVTLANQVLYRLSRDGRIVWSLGALPSSAQVAVDWSRGLIYLCDTAGRNIVKILDRAWCAEKGIRNDLEERVVALRARGKEDWYREAARLYEQAGGAFMATAYWQRVQEEDPSNADEAEARLRALEVERLRAEAAELDARARSTLTAIGMETARPLSVQAIQRYELLLSKAPGDARARAAMAELKDLFSGAGKDAEKGASLEITEIQVANLFPALMQWYATHPPAAVKVANPLDVSVERVRASLFIPGFMDLPVESETVARISPGESVTFALPAPLNQKALELQEDMAVQAQVSVVWTAAGGERSASRTRGFTLYRNSALSWDDTRRIASFITPNEQTVSRFAARAVAGMEDGSARTVDAAAAPAQPRFSRALFQAMRICDTLGAYGITYVPDPDSPLSRALGRREIVDTVRFARTTLYNRTGDCDDTTALLCSLLESAGIPTAVLTTPGHVFCAFNSGEPAENARFLRSKGLDVMVRDGSVWIPIETTVLSKGFMAAWASASELVAANTASGSLELIPVASMRDAYPALPLPADTLTMAEPGSAAVARAYAASLSLFTQGLYAAPLKVLSDGLPRLTGKAAAKPLSQMGILHALFSALPEAETAFRKALSADPSMASAFVNLANLKLLENDADSALAVVKQGLAVNADSALLNLLAARIYAGRGDSALAAASFARVKKASPDLAARYPELSVTTQRAGLAGASSSLPWGAED